MPHEILLVSANIFSWNIVCRTVATWWVSSRQPLVLGGRLPQVLDPQGFTSPHDRVFLADTRAEKMVITVENVSGRRDEHLTLPYNIPAWF